MAKGKNSSYKAILTVILVLALVCVVADVYGFFKVATLKKSFGEKAYGEVAIVLAVAALVCAFIYIAKGYTKEQAKLFRWFCVLYTASALFSILGMITAGYISTLCICGEIVVFGLVILLASAKDLGKTASFVLCIANVVVEAAMLIYYAKFIYNPIVPVIDIVFVFQHSSEVIMSLILFVCTCAKYIDKAARGTN